MQESKQEVSKPKTIRETLRAAIDWVKIRQADDGMWCGPLETNCCMEAQWILAMKFIDFDDHKKTKVLQYILDRQREDGSWDVYYGSEQGDINTTLECYFALRVSGFDPDEPALAKARKWLIENKWTERIRVFTKYWLALFGEWPWAHTPVIPPEIVFLPKWCPFNIYDFASWARATMMPITILCSRRPIKELPENLRLDELFPEGRDKVDYRLQRKSHKAISWDNLFMKLDHALHAYNRFPIKPFRESAIKLVLQWMLEHQDEDGAWGGIQPPWIYGILTMYVEGFSLDQINMSRAIDAFNLHWQVPRGEGIMLQASESPVWDTFLTMISLMDAGETPGTSPELLKALDYVLAKENRYHGDWSVMVGKHVEPGGWAFERANNYYPDIDDAAIAICALKRIQKLLPRESTRARRVDSAIRRTVNWILAMQNPNGGWAAFDRDNTRELVTKIPFADFGEMLDPPSADLTGHVVEALAMCGFSRNHPAIARAIKFMYDEQEDDGSWFGRWGVNYIYGTCGVLPALTAVGDTKETPQIRRALEWLASKQNADGGWGESIASYMEPKYSGTGIPSTASQTAWALMAIMSADDKNYDECIARGCKFLCDSQRADGTWDEPYYTGTGFPGYGLGAKVDLRKGAPLPQGKELARGFMLNYNWYRHYFPITALGRAEKYLASRKQGK
ncbi:squalene--hopene cyclase [Opitutia bacterium KCR 482]|nr:squalene--hopene cyclase [Opitutae bacterium KCR 482]MDY5583638.1 squalene--hopene cyclase [Candidatus Merdousia sp.]